jgi:hypothetical protein
MKRFFGCLSLLFFFILFDACRSPVTIERPEDYAVFPVDSNLEIYDFPAIFQGFWSGMDHNYLFWDRDPTDWDAVYDQYKPMFDSLGRVTATSVYPTVWLNSEFRLRAGAAIQWFEDMTKDMIDSHLRLVLAADPLGVLKMIHPGNNYISYELICPALTRFTNRKINPPYGEGMMFRYSTWENTEAGPSLPDIDTKYDFINGTIVNHLNKTTLKCYQYDPSLPDPTGGLASALPRLATGRIDVPSGGYILYLYTAGYLFYSCMEEFGKLGALAGYNLGYNEVISTFFTDLKDKNLKGVIFDLRGVVGGDVRDLSYIMGRMVNDPLDIGYQRAKAGEGRLDYGPWVPLRVMPAPAIERMQNIGTTPVVALVDELTSSGAEFIMMAIQAMPNGYAIGQQTYGATSVPHRNQKFDGGNFDGAPFFASLTVSSLQTKHTDGNVYEGIGIPPNANGRGTYASQDWDSFLAQEQTARRDNVLQGAIAYIRQKL